jgi:hypothetical protein
MTLFLRHISRGQCLGENSPVPHYARLLPRRRGDRGGERGEGGAEG